MLTPYKLVCRSIETKLMSYNIKSYNPWSWHVP